MKKRSILACMLFALGMISCGDIDNMDGPNAAIAGSLIDETTNKPIISEQPNGFRIKMVETSWSESATPEYFWEKRMVHLRTRRYSVLLMMYNR